MAFYDDLRVPPPFVQATGTRVALSSGDVFWVEGRSPERVSDYFGLSAAKRFPSGRVVYTRHVVQLTYGPIPSTEPTEKFEEFDD